MNTKQASKRITEEEMALLRYADDGNPHCADVATATCAEGNHVEARERDAEICKLRPTVGCDQ